MRRTKIVCTLGPASDNAAMLKKLIACGMNVARLNFSHGTHESHQKVIDTFKKVRKESAKPIALMLDTKGPEIRVKTFKNNMKPVLAENAEFTLTTREIEGDENRSPLPIKVSRPSLFPETASLSMTAVSALRSYPRPIPISCVKCLSAVRSAAVRASISLMRTLKCPT